MQVPWRWIRACPCSQVQSHVSEARTDCALAHTWWSMNQLGLQNFITVLLAKPCVKSTWVVGLTRITVTLVWGVSSNPVFGTGPKFLYESNPCDPVKIWFCTYWFHQVAFPLTDLWSFSFNCFSILVREERNNYSVMKTCWKCTVIRFFF